MIILLPSCCGNDPPQNYAISAHGDDDWHIDTAEEFLFGTDMGGSSTADNHCPDSWIKKHIHVDMTNTNAFYYDDDLIGTGDDSDPVNGIDQGMLFFYAGHGNPTLWHTLGNNAVQGNMKLGDCMLRYYWQCSCAVFAHGPRDCTGSTHHYSCPGNFDGSADSSDMRNVIERWGPVLDDKLRMACGVSTSAYCHQSQTNRIWNNYNNLSMDVADSFIDGLRGSTWVVPLCITKGGSDVTNSPLYDTTFTNQANTSGITYYHIQYLSNFESTQIWPTLIRPTAKLLPIYKVKPPLLQIFRGKRTLDTKDPLPEGEYIERALTFIDGQNWTEKNVAEPVGFKFMLASVPVEGNSEEIKQYQKNATIIFKRQIEVENGMLVNVLGEGGVIKIQMDNDGTIFNANKVWREIEGEVDWVPVKTLDEALEEAQKQLENPQAYELDHYTWGYKELAGSVEQKELRIVFQFEFVPIDPEILLEYPPKMIEIPGQVE
jgi:hypothetical protein